MFQILQISKLLKLSVYLEFTNLGRLWRTKACCLWLSPVEKEGGCSESGSGEGQG